MLRPNMRAHLGRFLLGALATSAILLPAATAWAVPVGDVCTITRRTSCAARGGVAETRGGLCVCVITTYTPSQIANADDGDVGLVPIIASSAAGDAIVRTAMSSAGQLHRHAVMFHDSGRQTRHNTMYVGDGDDGSTSDPGGAYVQVHTPLFGEVHLDEDDLRNGAPGAITQTVDDTLARGRLEPTGLVLKPRQSCRISVITGAMTCTEPDRARFIDAVTSALGVAAYYKFSDYTDQVSMALPFSTSRVGDLRGSHCSGYVAFNFIAAGLPIALVSYDEALRDSVAADVFAATRDAARAGTGPWQDFLAAITLHWWGPSNVANQVVNCFAGNDCGDTSGTWTSGRGTGSANSPDNLLPASFRLAGTASYDWFGDEVESGDTVTNEAATATTPFRRVEAQVLTGGYSTERVLYTW